MLYKGYFGHQKFVSICFTVLTASMAIASPPCTTKLMVVVPATLAQSPKDLAALGSFKEGSWKVDGGMHKPFKRGDTVQLLDRVAARSAVVKIGETVSWERKWAKLVIEGVEGSEAYLYAPLEVVRLNVWERFIHWCRSPWLGDTITGYYATTTRSMQVSSNRYAQPVGRAKLEGKSSLDLVEAGYGPYRVGMGTHATFDVQLGETSSLEAFEGLHPCKGGAD